MHLTREERYQLNMRTTLLTFVLNLLMGVGKVVVGYMVASYAILADGYHTLADALSDLLVLWGFHWGKKPCDDNHPYGHGKIETLITSLLALGLLFMGGHLAFQGVSALGEALPVHAGWLGISAVVVTGLIKELLYRWNLQVSKKTHSALLSANAWHHRTDAFASLAVLFGVLGAEWGLPILDPIAGFAVALLIIYASVQMLIGAGKELVETALDEETHDRMREIASRHPEVRSVHGVQVRNVGSALVVELHLVVPPEMTVARAHDVGNVVEQEIRLEVPLTQHVLIHTDPYDDEFEDRLKTTQLY